MRLRHPASMVLVCLLALATGVALFGAGAAIEIPTREAGSAAAPDDTAADAALVWGFYDAINATLATGDPAPLADLLAADFEDRAAYPGVAQTREGLVRHLLALRATFPTLWLAVEELHPHGDWVLARLRVKGAARGVFFGASMTASPASWEAIELVRIAGGRVAERRAAGDWPILTQPFVQVPLDLRDELGDTEDEPGPWYAGAVLRLGRLTYGPNASQPRSAALGPLLIAVERGALIVQVEDEAVLVRAAMAGTNEPPPPSAPPVGDVRLGAGDALVLPVGARCAIRNPGPAPAIVLTLALLPWSQGAPEERQSAWWESWLPDVAVQVLAEGLVEKLPEGLATLTLGRITLAAQAEVAAQGVDTPRLAVVEAGTLHLTTISGATTFLSAGQGTIVRPAAVPTFHNAGDGPLVILLATIAPSAPLAGSGEHTAAILAELGYGELEITRLRSAGIV